MRTTIDLPDGLYREAKMRAVKEGTTLKNLVVGLIRKGLHGASAAEGRLDESRRPPPPVAIRKVPGRAPVPPLSKRQLTALLEGEEIKTGEKRDRPGQGGR